MVLRSCINIFGEVQVMKKRMYWIALAAVVLLLCGGCAKEKGEGENEGKRDLVFVRYPFIGGQTNFDEIAYAQSGLATPNSETIVDGALENQEWELTIGTQSYKMPYWDSHEFFGQDEAYLASLSYDTYCVFSEYYVDIFKESQKLRYFGIAFDGLQGKEPILSDFSEAGLKANAVSVLTDIYGEEFVKYLDDYYHLECAEYREDEDDGYEAYVVSYCAYLNGLQTDDWLSVEYTAEGKLWSVYAKNLLKYIDVDDSDFTPVAELEEAISQYVLTLGYDSVSKSERERTSGYVMNSSGEVYYVSDWVGFTVVEEGSGYSTGERIGVKAKP